MNTTPGTTWPGRYAAIALSTTLALTACGESSEPDPTQQEDPICEADADCPGEQICQNQVCTIAETEETRSFGFTFIPDNSSKFLPQRTAALEVAPGDRLDFMLEPSVQVEGEVSFAESANVLDDGTLVFEAHREADSLLRRQVTIEDGKFAVALLPGTYDITFIPTDPDIPSRRWKGKAVQAATSLPLTLPPRAQIVAVQGTLTHRDPALSADPLSASLPVAGARVVALTRDTGAQSTVATTDENGNFELRVWADAGAHDLVIGPGSPNALIPQVVEREAFDASNGALQPLGISLGEWSSRRIELDASLVEVILDASDASDGSGLDFAPEDARLTLTAQLGRGELTLTHSLNANRPLVLLPLTYEVTFQPPKHSRFGALTFSWDAARIDVATFELEALPTRARLAGAVTTSEGAPLPDAQVEFLGKSQREGKSSISATDRPQMLTTDAEGRFEVWLERGESYDVTITPARDTGAPVGLFTHTVPDADEDTATFALPEPMALFGSVLDDQLVGQPNLSIELFEEIDGERRVVAQSRTDAQGNFSIVAPASGPESSNQ